jgi:2-dehydropantoate 2-reductase
LTIRSRLGDFHRLVPPIVMQGGLAEPFDLVPLSCKADDLDGAMASFSKAVGAATAILRLLNGMRRLDRLAALHVRAYEAGRKAGEIVAKP